MQIFKLFKAYFYSRLDLASAVMKKALKRKDSLNWSIAVNNKPRQGHDRVEV